MAQQPKVQDDSRCVVGRNAARGLLVAAAAEQRHHEQDTFRHAITRTANFLSLQDRNRIQADGGVVCDHHTPLHETWMLNPFACRAGRDAPHHLALIGICDHSSDIATYTIEVT